MGDIRKLAIRVSSQSIFKYICYNCGRLLTDECKRNISVAFDCSLVDLSQPPVLQKYDSIGDLLYVNAKNVWTACGNCRKGPVDLYNTSDPNNGQLYVPGALKDLVSP